MLRPAASTRPAWTRLASLHYTLRRTRSLSVSCRTLYVNHRSTGNGEDDDEVLSPLFNYTSGRWLYNEESRLKERQRYFDVDILCKKAAHGVDKAERNVLQCTKLAEGGSYRIFEITFRDDSSVIARLPYPATIPRTFGIASEVATMKYLRLHGIPVPEIIDWSSDPSNALGSEYMIMSKVPGQALESTWHTMTFDERKKMMYRIVEIERKWMKLAFPAYGSLYLKGSLNPCIETTDLPLDRFVTKDEFCVGPSTEYLWWYNGRHELGANGGPWLTPGDVLMAVGQRELKWLQRFGRPRLPREPLYRDIHRYQLIDPQNQMDNLLEFTSVAQSLEPRDECLSVPTLQHPDLSPNNILISDEGEITGILDWQHSVILPAFLQAGIPKHFQNYGDEDSEDLKFPDLSKDFNSLSETDKDREREIYRRRQVHYFYLGYTNRYNKPHFQAMAKHDLIFRKQVFDTARRPWEGDNTSLKAKLIQLAARWSSVTGEHDSNCPLRFSKPEIEECVQNHEKQNLADAQMENLRGHLGINIDGWVSNEFYDESKARERLLREQTLDMAETEQERKEIIENWPFLDHEEID